MNPLRSTALAAAAAVTLAAGAVNAQSNAQEKPGGGTTTEPRGPAPANPANEPEQAGALRYQGDPHGEKQSETRTRKRAPSPRGDGDVTAPGTEQPAGRTSDEDVERDRKTENAPVKPRETKP